MISRRYIQIFQEKNYSANLKNTGQKHTTVMPLKQMGFGVFFKKKTPTTTIELNLF